MKEVFNVHSTKDYAVVSTYHLQDKSLSLKAKGLLTILLTLPKDWEFSVENLSTLSNDGRTAVRTALQELEKHSYLVRKKAYLNNRISHMEYHIFETPIDVEGRKILLGSDFLTLEKLTSGNKQISINTTNNNSNSTNKELNKDIKEPIEDIKNSNTHTGKKREKTLFPTTDQVQEMIDYYRKTCTDLPQPRVINVDRRRLIKERLDTFGPEVVKEVIDKTANSNFLNGGGSTGWTADFNWIFKEKNFVKILEGNYDNRKSKRNKFAELDGKVKSIPVNRKKKEAFLEELRKNGERVEY